MRGEGGVRSNIPPLPPPSQNDITELFSLCNFVMPEIFGDRQPFNFVYQQVCGGGAASALSSTLRP